MNALSETTHNASEKHDLCSVLLAEDSEDDAYFFQRALKKSGMQCAFNRAANGKLAIEFLQAALEKGEAGRLPDILFLDLKMPVKSGFDVLEWMQGAQLFTRVKVVVLSGSNDHADRHRAAEIGAAEYLVKPITPEDIKVQLHGVGRGATEVGR